LGAPKLHKESASLEYVIEPWAHQREALERAALKDEFGLFFEQGTGKTPTTINMLREKYRQRGGRVLRTLIVAPPIVLVNWQREFLKHSRIKASDIAILSGTGKKRLELVQTTKARILITNFETLTMPGLDEALLAWGPECLVVDESQRCKDLKAKRTKACVKIADATLHRFILTGTPVLQSPMDLFAQFRILDKGETFGKNFFVFRATFFYDKNSHMPRSKYFPDWRIREGAVEEINKLISAKTMRVLKSECLDLPPLVRQTITVPLSPMQRKLYNEMRDDFLVLMGDRVSAASLAITKGLRLQQIVSGFIPMESLDGGKTNVSIKENPRADALRELLAELAPHHKIIVWACFKENYATIRAICDALKLPTVQVHGEIPAAEKQAAVDRFNADPTCRVFIGNARSCGLGVNLTASSYAIYYSRNFSLEDDLQSEARNHRGGSEIHEKITRIDLVAEGTIDEQILKRLSEKQAISDSVLAEIAEEMACTNTATARSAASVS
jgi:SNF2 family DNA or RNA helicase